MKSKLIAVGLLAILALSLLACSSPSQDYVSWEVPIDNFMNQQHISDQIEVPVGNTLKVILGSNPTTGFRWDEEAQISDTGLLEQVQHEFIGPESKPPPPPGTPGQEVWTFKALKEGTSTVSLEYSRPWEGGEKGEWTYNLTVIVR
ncbi:protease inhibitor I42 family protein [Chloroflexota bacterium]